MDTTFQKNLKQSLKGITLEPFCKEIGISYAGLRSMLSRGLERPSAKSKANLEKIGKALGFNPDELWHEQMPLTKEAKFKKAEKAKDTEIAKLKVEIDGLKKRWKESLDADRRNYISRKMEMDKLTDQVKCLTRELDDAKYELGWSRELIATLKKEREANNR